MSNTTENTQEIQTEKIDRLAGKRPNGRTRRTKSGFKDVHEKELIKFMNENFPDYHTYEYHDFMKIFRWSVVEMIKQGRNVFLDGIGHFEMMELKERQGSHPSTQEQITVPQHITVKFRLNRAIKNLLYTPEMRAKINAIRKERLDAIAQANLAESKDV